MATKQFVQQIDKLINPKLTLGLRNNIILDASTAGTLNISGAITTSGNISASKVTVSGTTFGDKDLVTLEKVNSLISGKVNTADLKVVSGGDNIVNVGGVWSAGGTLTLNATHKQYSDLSGTLDGTLADGAQVVVGVTRDAYGHIDSYTTKTINFSSYAGWNLLAGANGKIEVISGKNVTIEGAKSETETEAMISATISGDKVVLSHKVGAVLGTPTPSTKTVAADGNGTIDVEKYTFDEYGHVLTKTITAYDVTLPGITVEKNDTTLSAASDDVNGFYVNAITGSDGHTITYERIKAETDLDSVIDSDNLVTAQAIKTYVSKRLSASGSMIYKGTISTTNISEVLAILSATGTEAGWTYVAAENVSIAGDYTSDGEVAALAPGDMLIVRKVNDALKFDVVIGSDNKNDVTTDAESIADGYLILGAGDKKVKASTYTPSSLVSTFEKVTAVETGNGPVKVALSATKGTNDAPIYTVSHVAASPNAETDTVVGDNTGKTGLSFVIPTITYDSTYGHITGTTHKEFNLTTAVQDLIDGSVIKSSDFIVDSANKTVNLRTDVVSGTATLYKTISDSESILNWSGSDLRVGGVSVAKKIGAGYTDQIATIASDGAYVNSGKSFMVSGSEWSATTATDGAIPTAAAVKSYVDGQMETLVPKGTAQVVKIAIGSTATEVSSETLVKGLIKKIVIDVTAKFEATDVVDSGTIEIGGVSQATAGVDYLLSEVGQYTIEPYASISGSSVVTFRKGTTTSGSAIVYVEYVAEPLD